MNICIDRTKCSGHGRCYDLEPALFEPDDEGYGVVRNAEVPESLVAAAENAAANCPEHAIRLEA